MPTGVEGHAGLRSSREGHSLIARRGPGISRRRCALLQGMRNHTPDPIAVEVDATAVVAAATARASAALPRPVDARPQAHVEQFAPRITNAFPYSRVTISHGRRFRRGGVREVGEGARKHSCIPPPRPRWGLRAELDTLGYRPGDFAVPWRPSDAPPRAPIPGYMLWSASWSSGIEPGTNTSSVGRC